LERLLVNALKGFLRNVWLSILIGLGIAACAAAAKRKLCPDLGGNEVVVPESVCLRH
jgi:hypothetical protein